MSAKPGEIRLRGVALSPGVAMGIPCFLQAPQHTEEAYGPRMTGVEERRLVESLLWMTERLTEIAQKAQRRLGSEAAEIFQAHLMILEDPTLQTQLFEAIEKDKLRADVAVARHLELYETALREAPHPHIRERADDIAEIRRTLVGRLRAASATLSCRLADACAVGECVEGNDHIVIAAELSPQLTMELHPKARGIVVERGGLTSHAAILARALQLPAVSGIAGLPHVIPQGSVVLVDGDTGEVVLDPSAETLEKIQRRLDAAAASTVTPPVDGVQVLANIDGPGCIPQASAALAEGVGLYRTEVEVLRAQRLLSEEEQAHRYSTVVKAMGGRPVYIRLLDLGADKAADWLKLPPEDNPSLGVRGARLLLARPALLRPQARALVRASRHGPVRVIHPMIVGVEQFVALRQAFEDATADLEPGALTHGVMFEVPAACLDARRILEEAAFGCIGTNDLTQYLTALDRGAPTPAGEVEPSDHPALWTLIAQLAEAAKAADRPLSVCGELAGLPAYIQRLVDAGITTLSAEPTAISEVRQAARRALGCAEG